MGYVSAEWMEEMDKRDHRAAQEFMKIPKEEREKMEPMEILRFLRPYYEAGVDEPISPKNVKKKILPRYFRDVLMGIKTFELRKDDDDIQPGDILELLEWKNEAYTGRNIRCAVTYVLRDCPEYGLMNGYCIIGIKTIGEAVITDNYTEYHNDIIA